MDGKKDGWMDGWMDVVRRQWGAGIQEQMGFEVPLQMPGGGGGGLEKLELLQSCELKHSSHSRLLYCSDAPRRDKNVSDF